MSNKKQIKDPLGIEPCPPGPMINPVSHEDLCYNRFFITSKSHCWLIYRKICKIVKIKTYICVVAYPTFRSLYLYFAFML